MSIQLYMCPYLSNTISEDEAGWLNYYQGCSPRDCARSGHTLNSTNYPIRPVTIVHRTCQWFQAMVNESNISRF